MLNLFRRRDEGGEVPPGGSPGSVLASHILVKFLKRLRAMQRPNLLDLGRLSGANIEFFARVGCRVQVEDLLGPGDPEQAESAPAEAPSAPREGVTEIEPTGSTGRPDDAEAAGPKAAGRAPIAAGQRPPAAPAPEGAPLLLRPGTRPSRRIVLPPRVFRANPARPGADGGARGPRISGGGRALPDPLRCGLPTSFPFPDESFDAVVAWDIYNYYDPDSARVVAAETRRILKPGGLVLSYFHARRLDVKESPGRYRILDEKRVACDPLSGRLLWRHVYQNRDIEKMFTGLRIVELYFLKTSMREILMEKKGPAPVRPEAIKPESAVPKPRFTIE